VAESPDWTLPGSAVKVTVGAGAGGGTSDLSGVIGATGFPVRQATAQKNNPRIATRTVSAPFFVCMVRSSFDQMMKMVRRPVTAALRRHFRHGRNQNGGVNPPLRPLNTIPC
jgi:hypothetical protein